jgi:hypothetical protein
VHRPHEFAGDVDGGREIDAVPEFGRAPHKFRSPNTPSSNGK